MKKHVFAAALFVAVSSFAASSSVSADEQKFELKPSAGMSEILSEQTGKRVAIRLGSGDEIEGTVVQVGKSLVHLTRLTGKDYYDAVISIDKVSAVRIKVRDK